MSGSIKKELGDYQTPIEFADVITGFVKETIPFFPSKIIEPTCGMGHFLLTSNQAFPTSELLGIDINSEYLKIAKESLDIVRKTDYKLVNGNIFEYEYEDIYDKDKVLIIGNPPWATNADLTNGILNNLPNKTNVKNYNGFEAMTGASNFDICEYIILDVIRKINVHSLCVAMLCKTNVATNVIKELRRQKIAVKKAIILKFDAKDIFDVSADACLLYIEKYQNDNDNADRYNVYRLEQTTITYETQMGFINGEFVTDCDSYVSELEGKSPFEWRQGVKHDSSKVMELVLNHSREYVNGFNQIVDIEDTLVYPLLKSSDIKKYKSGDETRKYVIITQSKVGEDTGYIKNECPKLWGYLNRYEEKLASRKSSIYKKAPKFAIFGIGDYSFSKYKVAISGFYKEAFFVMLKADKPIMLDDTCYFLSFNDEKKAMITTILLNSDIVKTFLASITNVNSKRPYTKKVLSRINVEEVSKMLDFHYISDREKAMFSTDTITVDDYRNFVNSF